MFKGVEQESKRSQQRFGYGTEIHKVYSQKMGPRAKSASFRRKAKR